MPSDIGYVVESELDSFVHKKFGWSVRGKKMGGEVSRKRFSRESVVAGFIEKKSGTLLCYSGTCHASGFNMWIKNFLFPDLTL